MGKVGGKNDGTGNDGTRQRTSADLINPGDRAGALPGEIPLELEAVDVSLAAGSWRWR
jgi:hypothetical protein